MSQEIHNRKRRRADERTKQKLASGNNAVGESREGPYKEQASDTPQKEGGSTKITSVRLSEIIKRGSITDWLIAMFTFALTITAIYQYQLNTGQLVVMQTDQRAWMKFDPNQDASPAGDKITVQATVGKPIEFMFKALNVGRTPALDVHGRAFVSVVGQNQHIQLELMDDQTRGNMMETGILFPNQHFDHVIVRSLSHGPAEPATGPEVTALQYGVAYVAVFGRIDYFDVFHIRHWTKFCSAIGPSEGFTPSEECSQYNSVDDN